MKVTKAKNLVKIHLGCGKNALDDFINFDNNIFLFFKYVPHIESFFDLFNIFLFRFFFELVIHKATEYNTKRGFADLDALSFYYFGSG